MKLNQFFAQVAGITPSVLIGWVSAYKDLFKGTLIMRPESSDQVSTTGVAFATFLAIVFGLLCRTWPVKRLKAMAKSLLWLTIILGAVCYIIRLRLAYPATRELQEVAKTLWDLSTWVFIVAMVMTVLFATLFAIAYSGIPENDEAD